MSTELPSVPALAIAATGDGVRVPAPSAERPPRTRAVATILYGYWPLGATIFLALWFSLEYIKRSSVNLVYLDAFIPVPYIGEALGGGSLWHAATASPWGGQHLLYGYRLWALLNAQFFHYNARMDNAVFVLASVVLASAVYVELKRTLGTQSSFARLLAFAPLVVVAFSLQAPPLINMTTQFTCGTSMAVVIGVVFQGLLTREEAGLAIGSKVIALLALISVYFLLLSGAYFPGLIAGLFAMWAVRIVCQRRFGHAGSLSILGYSILCSIVFTYFDTHQPGGAGSDGQLLDILRNPLALGRSYLTTAAVSIIDSHTQETWSNASVLRVGGLMTLATVVAIALFIWSRMYEATYVPILCIAYPFGIATAQLAGRNDLFGWRGISAEWYAFHLRLLPIGVAWIVVHATVHALRQLRPNRVRLATVGAALAAGVLTIGCIGWGTVVSTKHQWARAPFVKLYYLRMQNVLAYPGLSSDLSTDLIWGEPALSKDIAILDRYDLSVYRGHPEAQVDLSEGRRPAIAGDWYPDGWVGKSGKAAFSVSSGHDVEVTLFRSDFMPADDVHILLNGTTIFSGPAPSTQSAVTVVSPQDGTNYISVECDAAKSPIEAGAGVDGRPLCVHVSIEEAD